MDSKQDMPTGKGQHLETVSPWDHRKKGEANTYSGNNKPRPKSD